MRSVDTAALGLRGQDYTEFGTIALAKAVADG
jgi:hypothetical protein